MYGQLFLTIHVFAGSLWLYLRLQRVRVSGPDADYQPAAPGWSGLLDHLLGPGILPHPRHRAGRRVHPCQSPGRAGLRAVCYQHRLGHFRCYQVGFWLWL